MKSVKIVAKVCLIDRIDRIDRSVVNRGLSYHIKEEVVWKRIMPFNMYNIIDLIRDEMKDIWSA